MLLEPDTLELAERAPEVLARLEGPPTFKLELPASQIELVTPARRNVTTAIGDLAAARRALLEAADGLVLPAAAGVHPFSPGKGSLNPGPRYERTAIEYGGLAHRQLVCALQVHVAVGGAERTLGVYNMLREHLPLLAALAANAPAYRGQDTGFASIRPKISQLLPRQGIPPPLSSWAELAEELRWGAVAEAVPEPGSWWWELRPHLAHGTLELRVPDAQTTLSDAAAVAAVAHALVVDLARRYEAGERDGAVPTWRIEENAWAACRDGVEGALADLQTGERRATREHLQNLLDRLEPVAAELGAERPFEQARRLVERNGAMLQRAVLAEHGPQALAAWLTDRFADETA